MTLEGTPEELIGLIFGASGVTEQLAVISVKLDQIREKEDIEMNQLTDVKQQVDQTRDVVQSAVVLINGLAAKLEASQDDPAAVQGIIDELKSSSSDLAAAVAANTPSAPDTGTGTTDGTTATDGTTPQPTNSL